MKEANENMKNMLENGKTIIETWKKNSNDNEKQ